MRRLTGIADEHPLRQRSLRNRIEHIDEYLDDWLGTDPRPFTGFETVAYADWAEKRLEDPALSIPVVLHEDGFLVELFGKRYRLKEIEESLLDAQTKVQAFCEEHIEGRG